MQSRCCWSEQAASAAQPPSTWLLQAFHSLLSTTTLWTCLIYTGEPPAGLLYALTAGTRQVIHDSANQGMNKALSAIARLQAINPICAYTAITEKLTCSNALRIITAHDLVVDATDNIDARYIINDACVLLHKPYISGSAVGIEGQIMVVLPGETPCYRCLYPTPSLAESCRSCANAGVLGPVPGLIGCLEAIEAIKLISSGRLGGRSASSQLTSIAGSQVLYDGYSGEFNTFQLPRRSALCSVCGDTPSVRSLADTEAFLEDCTSIAQAAAREYLGTLPEHLHMSPGDYLMRFNGDAGGHLIVDVRTAIQHQMLCLRLPGLDMVFSSLSKALAALRAADVKARRVLVNIPLSELKVLMDGDRSELAKLLALLKDGDMPCTTFMLCRRGIDSTVAARLWQDKQADGAGPLFNIRGGLVAWHHEVDPTFPLY